MFSREEKKHIAAGIEKILLDLNHPEMAKEKPKFKLHVEGKWAWSWADIEPNWTYEDKEPGVSEFNEKSREIHEEINKSKDKVREITGIEEEDNGYPIT